VAGGTCGGGSLVGLLPPPPPPPAPHQLVEEHHRRHGTLFWLSLRFGGSGCGGDVEDCVSFDKRGEDGDQAREGISTYGSRARGSGEERDYGEKGARIPPPLFPDMVAGAARG
jgi:hypothetical protein